MCRLFKFFCLGVLFALLLPFVCACGSNDVVLSLEGKTDYAIVYPSSATEEEMKVYEKFFTEFHLNLLSRFEIYDDSVPAKEGVKEILIGNTNRPESQEGYLRLGENQIGYFMINGNLVLSYNVQDGLYILYEDFFERCISNHKLILSNEYSVKVQCSEGIRYFDVSNLRGIGGDDPCVVHHTDGNYYYCWGEGNGFAISKIANLDKIVKDNGVKVYTAPEGTMYSCEYWAPELHYINGEWYVYVAADDGDNYNHRMYVFKGTSQDPTQPFEFVGKITDSTDKWAIDGGPFEYNGELYFVWSGWEGDENVAQNIYIAHMSDPCTIDSERVLLSTPTEEFEIIGVPMVNEGPATIINGDTVTIVYSGSGSWTDDYCLIGLTCTDGNLLNASSWEKSSQPLLSKTDKFYGPGHCFFTKADDGSYWVMYHANLESGTSWGGRSVRIQPVVWDGKVPTFDIPSENVILPKNSYITDYVIE